MAVFGLRILIKRTPNSASISRYCTCDFVYHYLYGVLVDQSQQLLEHTFFYGLVGDGYHVTHKPSNYKICRRHRSLLNVKSYQPHEAKYLYGAELSIKLCNKPDTDKSLIGKIWTYNRLRTTVCIKKSLPGIQIRMTTLLDKYIVLYAHNMLEKFITSLVEVLSVWLAPLVTQPRIENLIPDPRTSKSDLPQHEAWGQKMKPRKSNNKTNTGALK